MALDVNLVDLHNLLTGNIPKTTLSGRIFLGVIGNKLPAKDAKAFIYARGFNKIDDPSPSQLKQTIQEVCKLTEEEAEKAIQETLQTILEYDWHEVYDKEYEARQGFHIGCTFKLKECETNQESDPYDCTLKDLDEIKQELIRRDYTLKEIEERDLVYRRRLERELERDFEREVKS